jgi:prepilin-type processing-associated H-X9-DG protein
MKGQHHNKQLRAFTRIDLLALGFTVILFVGCLTPSSSRLARKIDCNNNLKQIGLAFKTWSPDQSSAYPMQRSKLQGGTRELVETGQVAVHFRVLSNELSTPKVLVCPADKPKVAATNFGSEFTDANVSYFLGVDAGDESPQSFLSGDRNLAADVRPVSKGLFPLTTNMALSWTTAIHGSCGNICFADGSVQLLSSVRLAEAARNQGLASNRLALP